MCCGGLRSFSRPKIDSNAEGMMMISLCWRPFLRSLILSRVHDVRHLSNGRHWVTRSRGGTNFIRFYVTLIPATPITFQINTGTLKKLWYQIVINSGKNLEPTIWPISELRMPCIPMWGRVQTTWTNEGGEGVAQMTTTLDNSYLVKVST